VIDDELKLCGELISKVLILSQDQNLIMFIYGAAVDAKYIYNAFLKFYEKFVKVFIFLLLILFLSKFF